VDQEGRAGRQDEELNYAPPGEEHGARVSNHEARDRTPSFETRAKSALLKDEVFSSNGARH
jgi:hypothetical protein